MAHKHTVTDSVEAPGGQVCVDIFRRPDGTWGFEEYRRDPEDPHGWRQIGYHDHQVFADEAAARASAAASLGWFS
ncbi:MAG: hypothetical protein AAF409_02315 [Pseudomonadota bacterium]